jgi:hypothetical protein
MFVLSGYKPSYETVPVPDKDKECDRVTEKAIPSASSSDTAIARFKIIGWYRVVLK